MSKLASIKIELEPEFKLQLKAALKQKGMTYKEALLPAMQKIVGKTENITQTRIKLPNADLLSAIKEIDDPEYIKTAKRYKSVEELMIDLNS